MESFEMEIIFKSLLKKGYLTDAEFQKIMEIENFNARILEVFGIMMVKDQTTAVEILNMFRRMTSRVRAKENNGIHPLLSAVVADCIFGFLPTKDVLNCRLVCHQWRTASSNVLRKRVTINFETQGPYKFFEDFANSLPEIKFQYFRFLDNDDGWNTAEIEEFFEKCGADIKRLRFSPNRLFKEEKELVLNNYDITPLILKACNLTKLKVVSCGVLNSSDDIEKDTLLQIQLSEVSSVKFISVSGCLISIQDDNVKIKPLKITLSNVTFKKGEIIQENILLNDVIDFSQATKLNLYDGDSHTHMDFDMNSQVLNTQSFHLMHIQPKNWASAIGNVYICYFENFGFKEKNRLQIQQLYCAQSTVNLFALPIAIEKLHFAYDMTFVGGENTTLPYLKYLRIEENVNLDQLAYFAQCVNLIELELGELYPNPGNVTLNVNLIPKSVKRMKIYFNNIHRFTNQNEGENGGQEIQDVQEGSILNLDTLILEDYLHCLSSEVSQMMSIIKPKVLVVSCIDANRIIDTTSICEFVYANRHLEKLIVGSKDNLHKKIPLELSVFSRFVGKKNSNYYQIETHHQKESEDRHPIGTPISEEEFDLYTKTDELDQRFYI